MSALTAIEPYPDTGHQLGLHGDLVAEQYLHTIKHAITQHPRTLQKRIGPSEIGNPCARRIGYKLLSHPETNHADVAWLPTIGTGVHTWLEDTFTDANTGHDHARWLTEFRVAVGTINGVEITGSCDLFDRATGTVIDHKIVGPTTLRKYRSKGPGQQYRSQIHLYGRGAARRGLPVHTVMIAFLPRNAGLEQAYLWHENYDEQVALDALQRAEGIATAVGALGDQALQHLPTAEAYCTRCPWFRRNSPDPAAACPGHPEAVPAPSQDSVLSLIG